MSGPATARLLFISRKAEDMKKIIFSIAVFSLAGAALSLSGCVSITRWWNYLTGGSPKQEEIQPAEAPSAPQPPVFQPQEPRMVALPLDPPAAVPRP